MTRLILLGTSNAIPDAHHENTHMVIQGVKRTVLIDCASNPLLRLQCAGIDVHAITDLILTHFHPDHVSGVPLLLMDMWLLGRRRPLAIFGLRPTLGRLQKLMGFFEWNQWPKFFPVEFSPLPARPMTTVLECKEFRIFASPVRHLVPAIGLRVDFRDPARSLAYSGDSEPCEQVVRLARGVDVLIHEAAGKMVGHSSAAEAGRIARQAGAGSLLLIHYPTGSARHPDLVTQARRSYPGPVKQAEDFMQIEF
jgi:ribonuclease Z